jgi:hypothetical protein
MNPIIGAIYVMLFPILFVIYLACIAYGLYCLLDFAIYLAR